MTESERRASYNNVRILIESSRILNPQFSDGVLHFTGAQIELLRNVAQYLDRPTTFVAQYEPQYYITPDSDDWDSITEIVASLQEILMGNNNVIFGYSDRWHENLGNTAGADGTYQSATGPVPNGYVYVLQHIYITNETGARGKATVYAQDDVSLVKLNVTIAPGQNEITDWTGSVTLRYGDRAGVTMESCLTGDVLNAHLWGYKMQVPTT